MGRGRSSTEGEKSVGDRGERRLWKGLAGTRGPAFMIFAAKRGREEGGRRKDQERKSPKGLGLERE